MGFVPAYSAVEQSVVERLAANGSVPYRATLAEALAEFPVGFYFQSDDKAGVGPHAGDLWIYKRIAGAPGYEAQFSGAASEAQIADALAALGSINADTLADMQAERQASQEAADLAVEKAGELADAVTQINETAAVSPRLYPMIERYAEIICDSTGRPIYLKTFDNVEYEARAGQLVQVKRPVTRPSDGAFVMPRLRVTEVAEIPGLPILYPLVSNWKVLEIDAGGRFASGETTDGQRYQAISGAITLLSSASSGAITAAAVYGDSTTWGADLDYPNQDATVTAAKRWSTLLGADLGIAISNQGSSGQTAQEIAARLGAVPVTASVTGGAIPASGPVALTGLSIEPYRGGNIFSGAWEAVTLDGTAVRGTLARSGSTYNFTRSAAGAAIPATTPINLVCTSGRADWGKLVFIGAGINNEPGNSETDATVIKNKLDAVKAHYRAMTSVLTGPFVVWGMLDRGVGEAAGTVNGTFVRNIEQWLAETYGARYAPLRQYLASQRALDDAAILQPGFVPTATDLADVAAGTVPRSFRALSSNGTVHLGELGHKLQARFLRLWVRSLVLRYL